MPPKRKQRVLEKSQDTENDSTSSDESLVVVGEEEKGTIVFSFPHTNGVATGQVVVKEKHFRKLHKMLMRKAPCYGKILRKLCVPDTTPNRCLLMRASTEFYESSIEDALLHNGSLCPMPLHCMNCMKHSYFLVQSRGNGVIYFSTSRDTAFRRQKLMCFETGLYFDGGIGLSKTCTECSLVSVDTLSDRQFLEWFFTHRLNMFSAENCSAGTCETCVIFGGNHVTKTACCCKHTCGASGRSILFDE
jgi:hypothetical protein